MATKQGVGIWKHYRTTDRADGLEFRGEVLHESVEAKLYWSPADWRNPEKSGKRPYIVVEVYRGKFDSFRGYEQELRWDAYVGEERKRRNWNELLGIAEGIGVEQLEEYVGNALWYHETMLLLGCTYENHTYYYPQGKAEWVHEQLKKEWKARKAA